MTYTSLYVTRPSYATRGRMCEGETKPKKPEGLKVPEPLDGSAQQARNDERSFSISPRQRSRSPKSYPGAKPITTGMYLEPHHLVGKLYRNHYVIQIPV